MRALVVYAAQGGTVPGSAEALQKALAEQNCRAELVAAKEYTHRSLNTTPYQLICFISSFSGLFKIQFPDEVLGVLKKCSRLQGKRGAAFVPSRFGSAKALKELMGMMEGEGVFVVDFAAVRSPRDMERYAVRLANLSYS